MSFTHLITRRDGAVEQLILNRPDVRNAFNEEVIAELTAWAAATREAAAQGDVRVVVLSGAGKTFCAGADVTWMSKTVEFTEEENLRDAMTMSQMFGAIDALPVPLVGRVQGAALGGGAGLAAVCDIVVAEESAIFGFTEVKLGILPAVISPFALAKIGRSAARELFLTGARFPAARAREIGLVHAVVPAAELDAAVERYVRELLTAGPEALAAAKALIPQVWGRSVPEAMPMTAAAIAGRRVSEEGQEGSEGVSRKTCALLDQEAVAMLKRLLVANRGEIALRIIRACRELGIESIAVHSSADAGAPHTLAADRAIAIGPAPASDSYLSIPGIIRAAQSAGADAIHPGYGFLSENPRFAEACAAAGIIFVGPPSQAIARMGSKIEARRLAAAAGVPVVPGETPDDQSDRGIAAAIDRIGLPALIKASAGGGGKGMRRVTDAADITQAIEAARREATAAFGDGTLYVEKLIDAARHVEIQVFADNHGQAVHLFERECSVQRRHQKVIEESPSPALTPELRARMTTAAVALARTVEYRNAGTIEFLVDGPSFYFLEMNTRLQVEHPVTEQVTGLDLVRAQLIVASGEPLPWTQAQIAQRGHAIEARVYAEDPAQGFLPQAGRLSVYRAPHIPGVRVDSGVAEGSEISVYYDPMLAKVIATAESRPLAISRLVAALRALDIEGVRTNVPFLIQVLELPEFREGRIDTGFLDREGARLAAETLPVAMARPRSPAPQRSRDPWDSIGTDVTRASRGSRERPATRKPDVRSAGEGRLAHRPVRRSAEREGGSSPDGARSEGGRSAPFGAAGGAVTAPMPATVLRINVKPGDAVKKGDVLVLLEAMKMELPVRAADAGVVAAIRCREGELVDADAVLLEWQ